MTNYSTYLHQIENNMRTFVDKAMHTPEYLYNMIRYHMGWIDADFNETNGIVGKRLRPLLLTLCCEANIEHWQIAMPAAIAVELLHNFTLIHDDIEDRDEIRHGRPTVWSLWGVPQAINAGDALYALAYQAVLSLDPEYVNHSHIVKITQVYTETILRITEGQYLDINFENRSKVTEIEYLEMIAGKTAAMFGLACELGAIIAGVTNETQYHFRNFGLALGMAFQMQDDILGLWGDPNNTGKPVGSDLVKGKKTLPIIHCAQENRDFFRMLTSSMDQASIGNAMRLFEETGSYQYTQDKAELYLDQALSSLDKALSGEKQAKIKLLVSNLTQRQM